MGFAFGSHGIEITVQDCATLLVQVGTALDAGQGFSIATLNLDHLVKMRASKEFTDAYAKQSHVVADGRPVVWLSKLSGNPIKLAPGSDLVVPLCQTAAGATAPIGLVGSTSVVLRNAKAKLEHCVPGLNVACTIAPSRQFDPSGSEARQILATLQNDGVRMCFLALGAPKQEQFAALAQELAPNVGFVSVGAGLDFIAGHQTRAPAWIRSIAMEWLWRALSSPVCMIPRYTKCFAILPGLTVMAIRTRLARA